MKSVIAKRRMTCMVFVLILAGGPGAIAQVAAAEWDSVKTILGRIVPPVFPPREYVITRFGAHEGQDCSEALANAINRCSMEGGGRVVVPPGVYLTGAIRLRSNVDLHVSKGATLRFSTDPARYLPVVFTRWEGVECMNYSALVYAYGAENIAVTGEGTLDGQASRENWWRWKGGDASCDQKRARDSLFAFGMRGVPVRERVFGAGHYLRPNFLQTYSCRNVLIQGVTFKNSPMWFLHPVLCANVSVIGVTMEGLGPNNDGCDPESCTDVLIQGCTFNNGDDCIAIKSGRNNDGRRLNVPSANIIIRQCTMKDGHGGVVLGSEGSGGIRNVYAEECTMDSPHLERMLRIKTNSVRGGILERIFLRNIVVGELADAVVKMDFFYDEGDAGPHMPVVRHVVLQNIRARKCRYPIWIRAYRRAPVEELILEDCTFTEVAEPPILDNIKGLTLMGVTFPKYGSLHP